MNKYPYQFKVGLRKKFQIEFSKQDMEKVFKLYRKSYIVSNY